MPCSMDHSPGPAGRISLQVNPIARTAAPDFPGEKKLKGACEVLRVQGFVGGIVPITIGVARCPEHDDRQRSAVATKKNKFYTAKEALSRNRRIMALAESHL